MPLSGYTGYDETNKSKLVKIGGLQIGDTVLTATAAELNTLAGVTDSLAELNLLHGNKATAAQLNEYTLNLDIADVSAEAVYYLLVPYAGTIKSIVSVADSAVLTADVTITAAIGAVAVTGGALTLAFSGAAAGDIATCAPTAANALTAGQAINFTVTGGGAAGTGPRVHLAVVITRT